MKFKVGDIVRISLAKDKVYYKVVIIRWDRSIIISKLSDFRYTTTVFPYEIVKVDDEFIKELYE